MNTIIIKGIQFNEPDFIECSKFQSLTAKAIKDHILTKKPCEICGNINSVAHHEVYSDYLNVRWLCRPHHSFVHIEFRKLNFNAYNRTSWQNNKSSFSPCRMRIQELINESGEKLTISKLAKQIADYGIYTNSKTAYDMIRYNNSGKAKSLDFDLLKYLCTRFNKKGTEIIQWES